MKKTKPIAMAAALFLLAACSSGPGTGSKLGTDTDDYKESLCACEEIQQRGLQQFRS